MKIKNILLAAGTALALSGAAATAADWDHDRDHRGVSHQDYNHDRQNFDRDRDRDRDRFHGRFIERERVFDVFRTNHIRYVGTPYIYNGYYVVQCYDEFGRLEYCRVNPYSGAFVGFSVHL